LRIETEDLDLTSLAAIYENSRKKLIEKLIAKVEFLETLTADKLCHVNRLKLDQYAQDGTVEWRSVMAVSSRICNRRKTAELLQIDLDTAE